MSFCTTRTSFRKTEPLLSYRPQPLSTSRSNTPSSSPPPAGMACVQRGAFALVRPFKSHSISLCGRLDSLPRRTTFRFRNALHLPEARGSVAYVRGIFQRSIQGGFLCTSDCVAERKTFEPSVPFLNDLNGDVSVSCTGSTTFGEPEDCALAAQSC